MKGSGTLSKYWMFSDEYTQNPYPILAQLRRDQPVAKVETPDGVRAWVVTRYNDVRTALADPRLSRDIGKLYGSLGRQLGVELKTTDEISNHLANSDPPRHTPLRKALSFAFTPKRVRGLREGWPKVVDDLLDEMESTGNRDLNTGLSEPLPIVTIAQLMGVPASDWPRFLVWTNTLRVVDASDPTGVKAKHTKELSEYLQDLIARKQRRPEDDLLSALVHADEDKRLNAKEALSTSFGLMTGGNDTTTAMINSTFTALLTHPDQKARIAADFSLLPSALDELLRYTAPVITSLQRVTLEPVELSGVRIPQDEIVIISLASANHDPDAFPDRPEELDITRPRPSQHVSFGHGIHYCLGNHMARALTEVAVQRVFERFPSVRLAVDPSELRYKPGLVVRPLASLPVVFGPPA
ncbi:cytochrome P450 family protein [Streptomyces poonensis]|uniref:Cytochrome P450 hydroxylase n=1 Tax=Streptomyces poonensis TaxID=68255 RepID=A0A918PWS1_9ACTN|nr:cytochrome P450 [Streptomyces poonensis]GGZ25542.1 cytochrome P450 hydroxylase [Streptomyces poonensis]GLJ89113.1 cytochrome P450 hydroxylase [Streptomyces poonensis]